MKKKWIFWIPVGVAGLALFVAAGGEIVRLLWNGLLPPLFGWHTVTFWQALGLLVLCRVLFGGWGSHGGPGPKIRRRDADRTEAMTPEERERVRKGLRECRDFGSSAGETSGQPGNFGDAAGSADASR